MKEAELPRSYFGRYAPLSHRSRSLITSRKSGAKDSPGLNIVELPQDQETVIELAPSEKVKVAPLQGKFDMTT